jgi:hypothetical protein
MSGLCARSARSRACRYNRTKQRTRSLAARDRMGGALHLTLRLATGGRGPSDVGDAALDPLDRDGLADDLRDIAGTAVSTAVFTASSRLSV